jgi:Flp pilus assembly pilin Flp
MLPLIEKDSDHMSLSRSVAFLIDGQPLEPEERSHLFECEECMDSTVDAVSEEMEKRFSPAHLETQKGVTVVEYALMLALVAIAVALATPNIASAVISVFSKASSVMAK